MCAINILGLESADRDRSPVAALIHRGQIDSAIYLSPGHGHRMQRVIQDKDEDKD